MSADTAATGAPTAWALRRDPWAWLLAATVAFATGYTAWLTLGLGVPPLVVGLGGASAIPGAIVAGTFAWQVYRRRVFSEVDRRSSRIIVVACVVYWLSAFTTPIEGFGLTQSRFGVVMFAAGIAVYPFVSSGLLALARTRPGRMGLFIFNLDIAIVGWATAMVLWHNLLYPLALQAGTSTIDLVLLATPPSYDLALALLAVVMIRVPMRGVGRTALRLLVFTCAALFLSDLCLSVQAVSPPHALAFLPDLLRSWFWAGVGMIVLALMHGDPDEATAGADDATSGAPSFRWLPYVAIAVAFVVPAIGSWGDLGALEQHIPASGLLIVLVLVRLAATSRQYTDLVASGTARRTEARFHSLVQNGSDLVVLADVNSRVRYLTPSVARVLGRRPESLANTSLIELLHPDDAAVGLATLAEVAATRGATRRAEWRLRREDGSFCETEVVLANMLHVPEVAGLVLTARDIGDRKDLERQLTFQALHDPLTGLANRNLFADRVEHALARTRRRRGVLAVLFLDLDDFKQVNDGHGHGVGDQVLRAVAERIAGALRESDTIGRLGGDEYAVLLEDLGNADEAGILAGRVEEALRQPFEIDGLEAFVSASIGVALGRGTDVTAEELLRNADVAMYVAKAKGKRRTETFDPSMYKDVRERLVLEADLRRAVEHREFEVFYQPVWATATRRMVGVEALVRWRHPSRGLLAPAAFIGAAEETGLIVPMGQLVLERACAQVAAWDRDGGAAAGLSIAVNISPRQLREANVVETIDRALAESGLEACRLNLEITEEVLVDDSVAMAELLRQLKALGVRISIDDFGTGYSSLSYLKRLPIDVLKIAKPFVDVITTSPRDEALSQAIVSLARSLQLEVVAEGIECQPQLDALVRIGCELGQGYLVSPPVPADQLPALASVGPEANAA